MVTLNVGESVDTVQVFHADTGALHQYLVSIHDQLFLILVRKADRAFTVTRKHQWMVDGPLWELIAPLYPSSHRLEAQMAGLRSMCGEPWMASWEHTISRILSLTRLGCRYDRTTTMLLPLLLLTVTLINRRPLHRTTEL